MVFDLQAVLENLGWQEGFQIPIANNENKLLEEEFARLSLLKTQAKSANEAINKRLDELKEHNKYVIQESEQNQKLILAHRQQLEREQNQFQTMRIEKDRLANDLKQTVKKINEFEERKEFRKQKLQSVMSKAERLKRETKWDEEALNAWEESLKKRDEDNELLKKFTHQDQIRYNELEAKRVNLVSECASKKDVLSKILTNCINYENIVTRTDKLIKQQITERDALITQWKESVQILRQRDVDIDRKQNQINGNTQLLNHQEGLLDEQKDFLQNEQKNNQNLNRNIDDLAVTISLMRKNYNDLLENIAFLNNEFNIVKTTMSNFAKELEEERHRSRELNKQNENNAKSIESASEGIKKLKLKEKELAEKQMTAEERLKNLQQMYDLEERLEKRNLINIERMNVVLYRDEQQLNEKTESGKLLELKIRTTDANNVQLKKYLKELDDEYNDRSEIWIDLSFKINCLEQKLSNLENVSKDEVWEMEERIQQFERVLAEHKEVRKTLKLQVNKMQEEMLRIQNAITTAKEQLETMKNKCEYEKNIQEKSVKQLTAIRQSCQERQVEENLIRLKVNNIERDIKEVDNNILSLQKVELNLEQAMRERQLEIDGTRTILQAKRRHLDEERGRLRADLGVRQMQIEQFKKKYHIALTSTGKGEDGEQLSVTHFKIQQAQEKFMLQQEGDELDGRIKLAEKEIVAMEDTLKVVNLTNVAYKRNLGTVSDTDEKMLEMEQLEREMKDTTAVLREFKCELKSIRKEMGDLKGRREELELLQSEQKKEIERMEENCELIGRQEENKEDKLQRTKCQLKKVLKKVKKIDTARFDRDFEIRQLQEANKKVLQQLVSVSMDFNEVAPVIKRYSLEYNVKLPERKLTPSTSTYSTLSSPSSCFSPVSRSSSSAEGSSNGTKRNTEGSSSGSSLVKKIDLSLNL